MELKGRHRRALRAMGHHLRPAVTVGKEGLAPAVLEQVEANLLARELVKVKLLKTCPLDKPAAASRIGAATGAAVVQALGRTLLLYRPHPDDPTLRLPD